MLDIITAPFSMVFWLIHIVLVIWGFLQIIGSGMSTLNKIIWMAIVFFFPVVGLILWFLIGNN